MTDKRYRVVLLDDNEKHLLLYGRELNLRFDVVSISLFRRDLRSVTEEIGDLNPPADAILLDVFQDQRLNPAGEITFISLLSALRERFRGRVPIIAFSGRPRDTGVELVLSWFRSGVDNWVWKDPRHTSSLVGDVESAIRTAMKLREVYRRPVKVLVSHGGSGPEEQMALSKVTGFMIACGVEPVVVEATASGGRSVAQQVQHRFRECEASVILATRDRSAPDLSAPRPNVNNEIGVSQERFGRRIVILLEEGCELPSNARELVYARFVPTNMESAFEKLVLEFREMGLM